MDSESCTTSNEKRKKTKTSNSISDDSNVSEPFRVRRNSDNVDEIDRFLLECEFGYVLPCGIILWTIFLLFWK